jgi:MoxR-like ATPase
MSFPYYRSATDDAVREVDLPPPWRSRVGDVKGYQPEPGLVDAVNVALALGQPLLLTGEPGTGKTQLAWHVSWQTLGADRSGMPREPLVFEAKSTSNSRELFYSYDTLGRFHKAKEGSARNVDYITYNALGLAILLANDESNVKQWLPTSAKGFVHDGPRRSVVLIDEVDKAPRDFPNDILNELEAMYFRIPELGNDVVSAPSELKPILIITSNSEKSLPDAFLRRCVYYNIPFPDAQKLTEIVQGRLCDAPGPFLSEALDFFLKLRSDDSRLRKKPATAELLGWLVYLCDRIPDKQKRLGTNKEVLQASLGALVKNAEDQTAAKELLNGWLTSSGQGKVFRL